MNFLDLDNLVFVESRSIDLSKILKGSASEILYSSFARPPSPKEIILAYSKCTNTNSWSGHKWNFPLLIITASGRKHDFFALTLSAMPELAPLTAVVRVIDWDEWMMLQPGNSSFQGSISPVLIGSMILGEVAAEVQDAEQLANLSISAFESSCSHSMAQCLARDASWEQLLDCARGWENARQLIGTRTRNLTIEDILRIWQIALRVGQDSWLAQNPQDYDILKMLRSLQQEQRFSGQLMLDLMGGLSPCPVPEFSTRQTIEERVLKLGRYCTELSNYPIDPFVGGFLVGSVATLLAPGETRHLDLVRRWGGRFPTALLWYFFVSGFEGINIPVVLFERGFLGLRCISSLRGENRYIAPPSCDVSLAELEVMQLNENSQFPIRLASASVIRIEIYPFVIATMRRGGATSNKQLDLFEGDVKGPTQLSDIRSVVRSIRKELESLESLVTPVDELPKRNRRK